MKDFSWYTLTRIGNEPDGKEKISVRFHRQEPMAGGLWLTEEAKNLFIRNDSNQVVYYVSPHVD